MDWALAVEVIKAIAWPIVLFYGIVTVRGFKLGPVLDRLKSGKIGPVEISLLEPKEVPQLPATTGIVEATGTAAGTSTAKGVGTSTIDARTPTPPPAAPPAAPPAMPLPPAPPLDPGPAAEPALVEFAPAGAIVNAWARFEEVVRRDGTRLGVARASRPGAVVQVMSDLRDLGVVAPDIVTVTQSMMRVRNEVVHPGKDGVRVPTTEAAQQFVETIDGLIERVELGSDVIRLRQLREQLGNPPPGIVRVGRLVGGGRSSTIEAAHAMAEARRGMWGARALSTMSMITDRDASLLLADGAILVRDIERDRDIDIDIERDEDEPV